MQENSMPDIEEFAERTSIQLKWNGGDERHQYIMASELNFTMEVNDAADLHFKHLFTGDESNYQVILRNENSEVLWRGYLLPEQYSEPYEHKILYVNFTATDGLARLKNKFYASGLEIGDRRSVISVLNLCLKQSKLDLPIYFAPSIQNDSESIGADWNKITIDMASYRNDDGEYEDYYKILEGLLETLGCTLLCYKDAWYILGHNRYRYRDGTMQPIECFKYLTTGVPDGTVLIDVAPQRINLESTPEISLLPPFQKVVSSWDIDEDQDVLPDDIIQQPYRQFVANVTPPAIKHWVVNDARTGLTRSQFGTQKRPPEWFGQTNLSDDERERRDRIVNGEEFVSLTTFSDFHPTNNDGLYMELESTRFLKSAPDYIDVDLEIAALFKYINGGGPFPQINKDDYGNQNLHYEILCNGETIISNRPDYENRDGYLLDISWEGTTLANFAEDPLMIIGRLSLKDMKIPEPGGLLQLRLYVLPSAGDNIESNRIGFRRASITYTADDKVVDAVTRPIDWSTVNEVDQAHGDNCGDMTIKQFDFIVTDTDQLNYTQYETLSEYTYATAGGTGLGDQQFIKYIEVSKLSWDTIQAAIAAGNTLYGLKTNETQYIQIKVAAPDGGPQFLNTNDKYYIYLEYVDGTAFSHFDGTAAQFSHRLFVYNEGVQQTAIDRSFKERWSRYGIDNENARYGELRAQVVHDTTVANQVKIDTNVFGLMNPLRLSRFKIDGDKDFITTDLTLDLDTGFSTATMIQNVYEPTVSTSYTMNN